MRAGQLRRRIQIQITDDSATDSQGGFVGEQQGYVDWNRVAEVWAHVEPLGGREQNTTDMQAAVGAIRITCRYRAGVKPANRILYGKRIFNIRAVSDVDERHREMVILADELQVGLGG